MQIELGSASQYYSTTLTSPPKHEPDAHNFLALASLLTVMIIAEPRLFPLSYCFRSRFYNISQRRCAFNLILVEDSTSCFSSSIFPAPKYLSRNSPFTLSHCQCLSTSTLTTVRSTVFAAWLNRFDNLGINKPAFLFLARKTDITLDEAYLT